MTQLHRQLLVDRLDRAISPHRLLACFDAHERVALLENPGQPSALGRYAYLCADPFWLFRSKRGRCWSGPPDDVVEVRTPPLVELARLLSAYKGERALWRPGLPPFTGGAVGYLGYELLYEIEDIPDLGRDDLGLPDTNLSFFGLVFAHDLIAGTSFMLSTGIGSSAHEAETRARARQQEGRRRLAALDSPAPAAAQASRDRELLERERASRPRLHEQHLAPREITACTPRARYIEAIEDIKHNISCGNVFEVCLTQRFDLSVEVEGRRLYDVLRVVNPAPMAAYLRFPECELLSSSPERFVSLDHDRVVETRPIKGTRPRGRTPEADLALRDELAAAGKDRAENVMIVDLARSDLGKVCAFGSVEVSSLCAVEPHAYTWQMVSTVRGRMLEHHDAIDLIRAAFPGGSMTGAPKVEAMKLIDRLEPTKRGVFSGSIGYFDLDGAIDLSIVIRTMIKIGEFVTFHVGGAIVADSDPLDEYQETLDKADGLVTAIDIARRTDHGGR